MHTKRILLNYNKDFNGSNLDDYIDSNLNDDDDFDNYIDDVDEDEYDSKDGIKSEFDADTTVKEEPSDEFEFQKVETVVKEELDKNSNQARKRGPYQKTYKNFQRNYNRQNTKEYDITQTFLNSSNRRVNASMSSSKNDEKWKQFAIGIDKESDSVSNKKRKYYCDLCNFSSESRSNVARHLKLSKHTEDMNQFLGADGIRYFFCKQCKFTTWRKDNYQRHSLYAHTDERPFPCSRCTYSGKSQEHLRRHFQGHEQDYHFECSNCDKTFRSKKSIMYHKVNVCTEAYFYKVNNDPDENILRKPSYPKKKKKTIVDEDQFVSSTTTITVPWS